MTSHHSLQRGTFILLVVSMTTSKDQARWIISSKMLNIDCMLLLLKDVSLLDNVLMNLRICQGFVRVDICGADIWSVDGPEIITIAGSCPLLTILDKSFIMETFAGYPLVLLAQHLKHLVTLVYIIATSSHSFERLTQIIERVTWLTASWVESSIAHRHST